MRIAWIGLAAALALCACGAVGSGSAPSPSPTYPAFTPGHGFDVLVTEKDTHVTLHVGQKLEAVLHANAGMTNWSNVRSTDTSVLMPVVDTAATAIRGVTLAGFQAVAPGHAAIQATAGAACPSPGQACPMYAILLSIDVIVTG
jgi:phage tail protein X